MAPKKLMIAVLEYWHGYLLLILDCKIYQEDQKSVPKIKAMTPIVHFSGVLVDDNFTDDCECEKLNSPFPLKSVNINAPTIHTNVPRILALPLLHLMFTVSNL